MRVGGAKYAEKENPTYGISSLQKKHIQFTPHGTAKIAFTGKMGEHHEREVNDPELVGALKHFHSLPGEKLFQRRLKNGGLSPLTDSHVRDYVKPFGVHPHNFRHYREHLAAQSYTDSPKERKKHIQGAVKAAAVHIGDNAPTTRKNYIHPDLLSGYAASGKV
jgi:DNA topoisomerase-1